MNAITSTPDIVIDFSPEGGAQGMHFDAFDLGFLGKKKVTRATEIQHNETTQLWDIILPQNTMPCSTEPFPCCTEVTGFTGYDVARRFEVEWIQAARMASVDPSSAKGIRIAQKIRSSLQEEA